MRVTIFSKIVFAKFHDVKNEFINKIYNICIFKGLVTYEDILKDPTY